MPLPSWLLHAALTLVLALVAVPAPSGLSAATTAQAASSAARPISGFFVSAGATDADNLDTLRNIEAVGGDTVVTFGTTLRPATLDSKDRIRTDGELDATFSACQIDGAPCAASVDVEINRVFTFANHSHFTGSALQCPRDRSFTSGDQRYTLLVVPLHGTGCTDPEGRYDLIAVHGGARGEVDRTTSLLRAADTVGMQVYLGMPSPTKRGDVAWLPDQSYQHTLSIFTDRFLRYHRDKGSTDAIAGFYHHTEMPVAAGEVWQPVLDLYRLQNSWIAKRFPDKAALVSPYLDNRPSTNAGLSAQDLFDKTRSGARAIAGTAEGVPLAVAIQDGMGTGKAGAYLANDARSTVDGPAAALVGKTSWASAYLMPVSDSFRAARQGLEDTGASLWSNVEGMTPQADDAEVACASGSGRGQTTKNRLDQQVQAVGPFTAKNISFSWDPFYTCRVGSSTLADALLRHGTAPVVTNAALAPDRDLLWLAGYNLAGSTATVKYVDTNGAVHQDSAVIGLHSGDYGRRTGLDSRLESADYAIDLHSPQDGKIFIVLVTGADGVRASRAFSGVHHDR